MKSGYSPNKATHAKSPRGIRPKALILLPRRCGEIRTGPLEEKGNSRTLPAVLPRKSVVEKTFTVAD
jgi:hypothetical protein